MLFYVFISSLQSLCIPSNSFKIKLLGMLSIVSSSCFFCPLPFLQRALFEMVLNDDFYHNRVNVPTEVVLNILLQVSRHFELLDIL